MSDLITTVAVATLGIAVVEQTSGLDMKITQTKYMEVRQLEYMRTHSHNHYEKDYNQVYYEPGIPVYGKINANSLNLNLDPSQFSQIVTIFNTEAK